MTRFSVNLNKVALLRNSRGGAVPDLLTAARVAIAHGAGGITLHPREDERHTRAPDVMEVAGVDEIRGGAVELNIEGDMRAGLLRLVREARPSQYTIVPVEPGEITSGRGWRAHDNHASLRALCDEMSQVRRMIVFCDPDERSVELAAKTGVDGVELYTGLYALAHDTGEKKKTEDALSALSRAAARARALGLCVHGGHDLTRDNLPALLDAIAFDELSIGHHIISDALYEGFAAVIESYAACIAAHEK